MKRTKKITLLICFLVLTSIAIGVLVWCVLRPQNVFEEMYKDTTVYSNPKISNMSSMRRIIEKGTMWHTNSAMVVCDISNITIDGKSYVSPDITILCEEINGFAKVIEGERCDEYISISFVSKEALFGYLGADLVIFEHHWDWSNSSTSLTTKYIYNFKTKELAYDATIISLNFKEPNGWDQYMEKDDFLKYIIYDWCNSNYKEGTTSSLSKFSYDDWGNFTVVE